eukprot:XP_022279830.1 uncharacterized protein LOC106559347 isoform X2 [Canis lupus familiaris]
MNSGGSLEVCPGRGQTADSKPGPHPFPYPTPAGTTTRLKSPEQVWPKLRALYETGPPPDPHRYWPGDWVYMQRHQQQTLQPHWKGPYIVILTTPTALKVDGVTPWVHYTHIRPADPHTILKDFVPE